MANALEQFKAAKDALLTEYKEQLAVVNNMRKELVKLGVLPEENATKPAKTPKTGKKGKHGAKVTEADLIAALGKHERGYKELAETLKAGAQTVKKILDNSSSISSRFTDPKNKKSKKLYKVK